MHRGLACAINLEASGIERVGKQQDVDEWYATVKPGGKCPFGQLPILETSDAGVVAQASAIIAYVARRQRTLGKNERERAVSDMLAGVAEDLYFDLYTHQNPRFVQGKSTPEQLRTLWKQLIPGRLGHLEALLGAGRDKFTGSGTTPGELTLFSHLHQMRLRRGDLLDAFPGVASFYDRVHQLPAVQRVLTLECTASPAAVYRGKEVRSFGWLTTSLHFQPEPITGHHVAPQSSGSLAGAAGNVNLRSWVTAARRRLLLNGRLQGCGQTLLRLLQIEVHAKGNSQRWSHGVQQKIAG
ncbi:Glutathione S-transferase P [Diplonema papillatum]|nr:Glutathione S-transferase P [Diplonema papillatum]